MRRSLLKSAGFEILEAQFIEWKFIKTKKLNSDLNFEVKLASAAIDLIISKKRSDISITRYVYRALIYSSEFHYILPPQTRWTTFSFFKYRYQKYIVFEICELTGVYCVSQWALLVITDGLGIRRLCKFCRKKNPLLGPDLRNIL